MLNEIFEFVAFMLCCASAGFLIFFSPEISRFFASLIPEKEPEYFDSEMPRFRDCISPEATISNNELSPTAFID